jgi:beta-galactosidase/beta-glucuronidase
MNPTKRPLVAGNFLKVDETRFYIKGTTYGTFAPDERGYQFPDLETVDDDFRLMRKAGINTVRTYTVPSTEILDLAKLYNLKIMIGLPWEQHMTFLDSRKQQKQIIKNVKNAVLSCNQHHSILCYAIGNEIPSRIVRWHGEKKVIKFLHRLYNTVKEADPEGLVTYVNYPTTEYLQLPMYILKRKKLLLNTWRVCKI